MNPDKKIQPQNVLNYNLAQAATQFILTLPSEKRTKAQQEIYKFVRWFGETLPLSKLTIPEVENYTQQIRPTTPEMVEKLVTIKTFLNYAYKHGLTTTNLANSIKVKKILPKVSSPKSPNYSKVMLTPDGYANLQAELESLKKERPRIAEELQKAAADKDLRENAPFEAIKEYQGQVEARIRELEAVLENAVIVNSQQESNQEIALGDVIKLKNLTTGETVTYILVDSNEANPWAGKISIASPMGQALLGKTEGQKVEVKAPAGVLLYQIEAILRGGQTQDINNK